MAYGKKIELFLKNGSFSGTVTAELSNWSGKAFKISRDDVEGEPELEDIGVYFLFCGNPASEVYIGESENIRSRLKQHKADYLSKKEKFFWDIAVCVTGRDLDKSKIKYLENLLVNAARDVGNFSVLTKASSPATKIKASSAAEMDEFADIVKTLTEVLGYNVFGKAGGASAKPIPAATKAMGQFRLLSVKLNVDAKMETDGKTFIVKKGSRISSVLGPSMRKSLEEIRKDMTSRGKLGSDCVIQEDVEFESPSAAAVFVLGRSANGKTEWAASDGTPLGDWLKANGAEGE